MTVARVWKAFSALFLLAASAHGEGDAPDAWRVWIEPKFMHAAVSAPIAGAKRAEFAAGALAVEGLAPLSKSAFDALAVTWPEFFTRARSNAAADLTGVKVEYVRNRQKVIEYAELHSEEGLIASAVLAPKFVEQFAETLGPSVLLAVPNRFTAYAFPKLASNYQDYLGMVLAAYRATAFPVSLEVFEVDAAGVRAVGFYPDPARD